MEINTVSCRLVNTANIFPLISSTLVTTGMTVGPTVTTFAPISGSLVSPSTTETDVAYAHRLTYTAKELGAYAISNTNASLACTVTVRDNLGDSAIVVSYAAGQTGLKNDSSNTASITSGADETCYGLVNSDATGTVAFNWLSILGDTSSGTTTWPGWYGRAGWF